MITPTVASRKSLVWIRPSRVGTTGNRSLHRRVAGPFEPLRGRPQRPHLPDESPSCQVVGDLLGRDLQPEEGVDAREVAAERRRSGGVEGAVTARRPLHLEVAL